MSNNMRHEQLCIAGLSVSRFLLALAPFFLSAAISFSQATAPVIDQKDPVICAARTGDVAKVVELLNDGTSVNSCDEFGETALWCALEFKHLELARELVRRDFNPTLTYYSAVDRLYVEVGRGPLTLAVADGADDIVDALLAKGIGAFSQFFANTYPGGSNPLLEAIHSNRPELVRKMLNSVDAQVLRRYVRRDSYQYLDACRSVQIVDMLVESGADVNDPSRAGPFPTALYSYSKRGWKQGVEELLKLRADPNKGDSDNNLPIDVAATAGIRNIISLADVDAHLPPKPDSSIDSAISGRPPRALASIRVVSGRFHREVIATALMASEQESIPLVAPISLDDLNATDTRGWSLLNYALRCNFRQLASALLDRGVDVSHLTKGGSSMTAFAANHGYLELVRRIAAMGAPVNAASQGRANALTLAIKRQDREMVATLLQVGAKPVPAGMAGIDDAVESSLMSAAHRGNITIMQMLLEAGADINELNMWDENAFFFAVRSGKVEAALWLAEHGADFRHITKRNTNALTLAADLGDFPMVKAMVGLGLSHPDAAKYAQIKAHIEIAEYLRNLPTASRLPDAGELWNRFSISTDEVRQYIASGGDVNYANHCPTPLQRMAWIGDPMSVALLLDHGADPNKLGDFQGTAVAMALYNLRHDKTDESVLVLIRLFVEHGVPIEGPERQWSFENNDMITVNRSLLYGTIEQGYLKCAKYLLEKGANPWFEDEDTHNNAFDVLRRTLHISEEQRAQFDQVLNEYGKKTEPPGANPKKPAIAF